MELTEKVSQRNYIAFIWHGIFLSLASNFTDVHSIIPALLIKAGGNLILLGLLTAIMMGGSGLMQIVFASKISKRKKKKSSLLTGINLRVFSLLLLGLVILFSNHFSKALFIFLIFLLITIFSFSGSYAAISYVDIVGKSILYEKRKNFFSLKQTISSFGIFISAFIVRQLLRIYPDNYGLLFVIASILLFIATLGFWMIKEPVYEVERKDSFVSFLKRIFPEIRKNANLKYYLLTINLMGLGLSIIPFMVLFLKNRISSELIGNILLLKVVGMSLSGLVLYKISFNYKTLLKFASVIGFMLPVLSLIFIGNSLLYQLIFILSGIFITSFSIAKSGILLEISNKENRAVYTGISGAGYLLPMLFPLFAGILIRLIGYRFTFLLVSIIILSAVYFINRMECKEKETG